VTLRFLDHQHIDGARADPDWAAEATVLLSSDGALVLRGTLRETLDTAHPPGKPSDDLDLKDKKAIYEQFNGKIVYHTDKNNIEKRLEASRAFRRMMSPFLLHLVSTNGIDVDAGEAFSKLVARGSLFVFGDSRAESRLIGDESSVFFRKLQSLPCIKDSEVFVTLYTKGFENLSYGSYRPSLQEFAEHSLDV